MKPNCWRRMSSLPSISPDFFFPAVNSSFFYPLVNNGRTPLIPLPLLLTMNMLKHQIREFKLEYNISLCNSCEFCYPAIKMKLADKRKQSQLHSLWNIKLIALLTYFLLHLVCKAFFPFIYKTHCFCSSNLETFHVRTYKYIYIYVYIYSAL